MKFEALQKLAANTIASAAPSPAPAGSSGPGFVTTCMTLVLAVIILVSVFALIVAILLAIATSKYNHKKNSLALTGKDIARQVLDEHDLKRIKVVASGSILFGNSYSRLFRRVRLRRMLCKTASVSALAVATQKSALAILDHRDDAVKGPRPSLIYVGPLAMLPLLLIGWLLDTFSAGAGGTLLVLFTLLAVALYLLSFVLAVKALRVEKSAQELALKLMETDGLATEDELAQCKKLYRLYRIEYINTMLLALLELLYRVLQVFTYIQGDTVED